MNLKNSYYYFKSALSEKFCQDVIQYGKSMGFEKGIIGEYENKKMSKKDVKNLQKKRKSEIVWLNDDWIYKEVTPFIHEANREAGWNFEWDWSEACQFTKYGVGQHYGWHCDSWPEPYDKNAHPNFIGKIRKLSVTISLSDPTEYDGGNLEFDFRNQVDWERDKKSSIYECIEIRPRGSIIIFPSFMWHRVTPVTRGERYSLVVWNVGQPWR